MRSVDKHTHISPLSLPQSPHPHLLQIHPAHLSSSKSYKGSLSRSRPGSTTMTSFPTSPSIHKSISLGLNKSLSSKGVISRRKRWGWLPLWSLGVFLDQLFRCDFIELTDNEKMQLLFEGKSPPNKLFIKLCTDSHKNGSTCISWNLKRFDINLHLLKFELNLSGTNVRFIWFELPSIFFLVWEWIYWEGLGRLERFWGKGSWNVGNFIEFS